MNCVKGEIHNVLSMMRVNARWASMDRFTQEIPAATQSPMMRAFKQLHYELQGVTDLSDVDTVTYLLPFVMVIESEKTSGYITGAAISSLNKFLLYGLITNDSLRADVAINRIAVCVSRCRFEETHRADDEAVLMKLLELVEYAVRCEVGPLITGENVWKMAQLCYSISCQPRSSLHLARAAENTLAHLVLTVFDRIDELEPKKRALSIGHARDQRSRQQVATPHNDDGDDEDDDDDDGEREGIAICPEPVALIDKETRNRVGPYGIPLLEQLLAFLASLIAPSTNDDATCVLGLRLINIVLETAGTGLGAHAGLVSVLQGDLSKFLLQNSETDELAILSLTLRVVFNLFNSIKDHLKVQLEVFFTSVHMRIIDARSSSNEQRELALESLLEFCREPALMLDLYVNYDCDVHCTNLFEVLCKALARNCQRLESADGSLNALSLLCLEGLLAVIDSIARRCPLSPSGAGGDTTSTNMSHISALQGSDLARFTSGAPGAKSRSASELSLDDISPMSSVRDVMQLVMSGSDSESDSDTGGEGASLDSARDQLAWLHTARERTAEVLQQRKRAKKRYALAADKFNTDQKSWIAFSQQIGLLPDKLTPESVASFLLHTPGLNKTLIGDYIGDGPVDKYPFNAAVRDAYIAMFDFRETPTLDAALRTFLAKFRLPGEAQKIDRMMEAFSKAYFVQASGMSPLVDADAAYVLSFSIIMLNTDLHSDHIPKKMTLDEFVRNNRGINGGQDLPRAYLAELYDNIRTHQIQMQHDVSDFMDNNTSALVDRYSTQWDGVLKRSANVVGASFTSNASILQLRAGLYEQEMFHLIAESAITSILLAYEKTCDVTTMERALEGLRNCAKIALYYHLSDVFNRIMSALASYFLTFAHGVLSGEKVYLPVSSRTGAVKRNSGSAGLGSSLGASSGSAHTPSRRTVAGGTTSSDDQQPHGSGDGLDSDASNALPPMEEDHVEGAKTRRALLSLKLLFQFVQSRSEYFRKAWTSVVECILMFNELDVVPISFVEIDDFVDSRGVPLPPIQGAPGSPKAGASSPTATATTSASSTSLSSVAATGVGLSGKTRERSRRLAERQAAIRSRMKSMSHGSHGSAYGTNGSHPSGSSNQSASLWGSLSSYLWADDDKVDDSFSQVNKLLRDTVVTLGGGVLEKDNWLRLVRKLPAGSLLSLLETLLACRDPFKCIVQPSSAAGLDAMMQENAILVLEQSVDLILVNSHRILALNLWDPFHTYAKRILSTPLHELHMQGLVERVVVHILRVCIRLFHDSSVRPKLVATLELLLAMDDDMYRVLSDRLASGVNMLLKANLVYMHDFDDWAVVLGVLENVVEHKSGRAPCWDSVTLLADGGHLTDANVTLWIAICLKFVRYRTPYSVDALRLLQALANNESSANATVSVYKMDGTAWLEVMRVMLSYLSDDRAPIAKTAWECLYSSLLQPGAAVSSATWQQCFEDVIFAFDDQVRDGGVWQHSKDAALYSVTLLAKTFLHNLPVLLQLAHFRDLWLQVLRRLATKLVVSGASAATSAHAVVVYETTLQSLYNLLLVLRAEEVLERVSNDATQQTLLDETCAVIDEVCPHVKEQLGLAVVLAPDEPDKSDDVTAPEAAGDDDGDVAQQPLEQGESDASRTSSDLPATGDEQQNVDTSEQQRVESVAMVDATSAPGASASTTVDDGSADGASGQQAVETTSASDAVATESAHETTTTTTTTMTTTTMTTAVQVAEVTTSAHVHVKVDGILLDEITEAV